ncbi:MAG: hypothetical protein CME06_16480 [Gemmatimonadetes bacterium]|nr:hypothetical protein [Gemmatimonadota bacterium]
MHRGHPLSALSILVAVPVLAQGVLETATLDRSEEFVELIAGEFAGIDGLPIDALTFYSWRGASFSPIPHQVDEVGPNGGDFGTDEDPGNFDPNDEIVFVLEDAGDRVYTDVWAPNGDPSRWEIEVEDPLNPGEKSWVYVFTGGDVPGSSADYVQVLNNNPLQLSTTYYEEGFREDGPATQTDMIVYPQRGNGQDSMDRLKLRTKLFSFSSWDTEEDSEIDPERWNIKDGTIRIINSFWVSLGELLDLTHATVTFYPQMTTVDNDVNQITWPELRAIVWLEDLNQAAGSSGGFWYHDNRGPDPEADVTFSDQVDGGGEQDTADDPALFYEWASADYGRMIFIQSVQPILDQGGNGSAHAYYCDGCTTAPWPDTGDMEKWGEFGTWIKKIPVSTFSILAWNFRLDGANPETSIGGEYGRRYLNHVSKSITTQLSTSVEGDAPSAPALGVALAQNAPNPFNPRTQIVFTTAEAVSDAKLAVFDHSGRLVRTLVNGAIEAGAHSVTWEGRDEAGLSVPSGIYLYRLEAGNQVLTRRMALVK